MKRTLQILGSASAVSLLAFSAVAADAVTAKTDQPTHARAGAARPSADRLNGAIKASDIIGMTVENPQNEKLGKVRDLAVDVESGRVVQVILSSGGFMGLGRSYTAVPPSAFQPDAANSVLRLNVDEAQLKNAPKFKMSQWSEQSDAAQLTAMYRHYGQENALNFIDRDDAQGSRGHTADAAARPAGDVNQRQDQRTRPDQARIPADRLRQMQRASQLIGTNVENLQAENLGDVEDLLVDLPAGRIVAVVVSSGGFLGLGEELSPMPPTALRFTADREALQVDASKEMLSRAPHFPASQWADLGEPGYAGGVYQAYNVAPYFDATAARTEQRAATERDRQQPSASSTDRRQTDVDNTAQNQRDRDRRTVTPLDQGNSKADVDTTAQIRREIHATESMSVNARNVKIVTHDGQVTLRGPVNSSQEKQLIGEIANRIARQENVDNQLEVKVSSTRNQ